ncbi:MAG: M42 family peptidase [Clostridia bacterium]|nr:M42 family peptidase [Clostridia bacterium]
MNNAFERLEALCSIDGISGREDRVREYIISSFPENTDYKVDNLGNIIAYVKGRKRAANRVMLSAHMDEVGFIVTYITEDGYIKFDSVGGINEKVTAGRILKIGEQGVYGAVCMRPVHLCSADELNCVQTIHDMCIDIGASSRLEAERKVSIGDSISFVSDFVCFGNGRVKAKAIDDRFGCAVLLRLINEVPEYDTVFTFVVQEEVGLRGAAAAAYTVSPDYAIVVEATTACDIAGVSGADRVCSLGGGAVVSYMDRHTMYDRALYAKAFEIARENSIKCQTKTVVAGGNDAGAIHKSTAGVRIAAVSLPCRYIHSAGCVADIDDMENVYRLVKKLGEEMANA